MNLNEIYTSNSLQAADLKGRDATVTIESFEVEQFDEGKKLVLKFRGSPKTMPLNKTNARTIGDIHGSDVNNWIGQQITLYPTKTDFNGKRVECIRIRDDAPAIQAATVAPQVPPGPAKVEFDRSLDDQIPF